MKITLYQGCKLTNKYKEVFSMGSSLIQNSNILENYLNDLNKKNIELDYVYQELTGTVVFDYGLFIELNRTNIYTFNYMKIESMLDNHTSKFIRYCFITDIILKNDLVYLSYEEDIWHSYNDKIIGCNNSFLSRLRYLDLLEDYKNPHFLPIEYEGNRQYTLTSEFGSFSSTRHYNLFVKLQYYTLTSGSSSPVKSDRNEVLLHYKDVAGNFNLSETSLYATIEMLLKLQNSSSIWLLNSGHYFDILEFYVVPSSWITTFTYTTEDFQFKVVDGETVVLNGGSGKAFREYTLNTFTNQFLIPADFKINKIGFLSKQFDVIQNGIQRNCSLQISANRYEFKMLFNYDNNIEDITELFKLMPFYNTSGGEIVAQRNLEYAIGKVNVMKGYTNSISNIAGAFTDAKGDIKGRKTVSSSYSKKGKTTTTNFTKSEINKGGLLSDITSSFNNSVDAAILNFELDFPRYSFSSKANIDATALLNAYYGFCKFTINSSNSLYINYLINNEGYKVFIPISNFNDVKINNTNYFINNDINYNVIEFDNIDIYGDFPSSIANSLEKILLNGVKIWYNKDCIEDEMEIE